MDAFDVLVCVVYGAPLAVLAVGMVGVIGGWAARLLEWDEARQYERERQADRRWCEEHGQEMGPLRDGRYSNLR